MASYLVKKNATISVTGNESYTHFAGDVLSDWELPQYVKDEVNKGTSWYTQTLEPLTDKEAELYRKKATAVEGKRQSPNGQIVDPPWDDFIGLHPNEILKRMENLSFDDVEKVRQYERAGMNRDAIINFVAASEREPWHDYDNWSVRDILDKLELLHPQTVQDAIVYEMNHKKRPAVIEFEPEPEGERYIESSKSDDSGKELVAVGNKEESTD